MIKKTLKLMGGGFIYGLTHPFDGELKGRPVDKLSITEALLDGASAGLGQAIVQGTVGVLMTAGFFIGLGFVNSKLNKTPVKVKMVVDETPKKK